MTTLTEPTLTGCAQHDGLALLAYTIRTGFVPVETDNVRLALHVAPIALSAPGLTEKPWVLQTINYAVGLLSAAVRRRERTEVSERDERRAKLLKLFDVRSDDEPDQGPMAPLAPQDQPMPPTPVVDAPEAPALTPFDQIVHAYAKKAGVTVEAARRAITAQLKTKNGVAPKFSVGKGA